MEELNKKAKEALENYMSSKENNINGLNFDNLVDTLNLLRIERDQECINYWRKVHNNKNTYHA